MRSMQAQHIVQVSCSATSHRCPAALSWPQPLFPHPPHQAHSFETLEHHLLGLRDPSQPPSATHHPCSPWVHFSLVEPGTSSSSSPCCCNLSVEFHEPPQQPSQLAFKWAPKNLTSAGHPPRAHQDQASLNYRVCKDTQITITLASFSCFTHIALFKPAYV